MDITDNFNILFDMLDLDSGGTVDEGEFDKLIHFLTLRVHRIKRATFVELWLPSVANSGCFTWLSSMVGCWSRVLE